MQQPWDIPAATALYNIDRWGRAILELTIKATSGSSRHRTQHTPIDIMDVVAEAQDQGLKFPILLRFQDLLRHRVETINRAFSSAVEDFKYQGVYRGVFPIKVNQLQEGGRRDHVRRLSSFTLA
jgi:arginine decarboxylase